MKFWQVAVIFLAVGLLGVATLRLMPPALSATRESEWLAAVIFGFIAIPSAVTATIMYGVWKLGNRRTP